MNIFESLGSLQQRKIDLGESVRNVIATFRDHLIAKGYRDVYVVHPNWALNNFKYNDIELGSSFKFESTNSFWGSDYEVSSTYGVFLKQNDTYTRNADLEKSLDSMISDIFVRDILPKIPKNTLDELVFLDDDGVYFKDDEFVFVGRNIRYKYNELNLDALLLFDSLVIEQNPISATPAVYTISYTSRELGTMKMNLNGSTSKVKVSSQYHVVAQEGVVKAVYTKKQRPIRTYQDLPFKAVNVDTGLGDFHLYFRFPDGKEVTLGNDPTIKYGLSKNVYDRIVTKEWKGISYLTIDKDFVYDFNTFLPQEKQLVVSPNFSHGILTAQYDEEVYNMVGLSLETTPDDEIYLKKDDNSYENFRQLNSERKRTYTHTRDYNYRESNLNFFNVKNEAKPLYMGVELEIDDGGRNNRNSNMLLVLLNNYKYNALAKRDGSLNDGLEIVTMPATLASHEDPNVFDYGSMFRAAKKLGYTGSENDTAGIHVHVDRAFFTDSNLASSIMYYILENDWGHVAKIAGRAESSYAKNLKVVRNMSKTSYEGLAGYAEIKKIFRSLNENYEDDRYSCINILNRNTIEFRFFKSTLNTKAFFAILQFVDAFARYVEHICLEFMAMEKENTVNPNVMNKITTSKLENVIEFSGKDSLKERFTKGSHSDSDDE